MAGFEDWAHDQGATLSVEDVWLLGQNIKAEKWIKEGRPVLLGIGFFEHYVVAIGWGLTSQKFLWWDAKTEYVYANFGWGGIGNGWIKNRPFYAGTIE